ncbi:pseudouridine synthase [Tumebacillus sp. ITR2]|uniref:Pseudouridine synthase n=1 Tax=Tumebacillus amylolyticus TaxID=2801339 RepID=A0ABS1JF27_9BACL|nr:pseudouridine synthase [Tumebacillus amylolyticus]
MRINKYIAETGYCSRREVDQLIAKRRVTINGKVAELGSVVGEDDDVHINGKLVGLNKPALVYIALNKPAGITSTTDADVHGNVVDYIGHKERIFPIGRLDKESEGLILLTNDGDIVNLILRKEGKHEKEYLVSVDKPVTQQFLRQMATGVRILGQKTLPAKVSQEGERMFRIVLTQGLNRQIRRMCEALGYEVRRLQRVRVMNIHLGGLQKGEYRNLTEDELQELFAALDYQPEREIAKQKSAPVPKPPISTNPRRQGRTQQSGRGKGKDKSKANYQKPGTPERWERQSEGDRPNQGNRPQQGEGSYQGNRSQQGDGSYKGNRPQQGEGSYQGNRSQQGGGSYKGNRPQQGEGSYQGNRSQQGGGSYKGNRPQQGEGSYQGNRSQQGGGSYKGNRPQQGEGSYQGNRSQQGGGSYKGNRPQQGEGSYQGNRSQQGGGSYKGNRPQQGEGSYQGNRPQQGGASGGRKPQGRSGGPAKPGKRR